MIGKYECNLYASWKSKKYSLVIVGNTFYIIENKRHWFKYKHQGGQLKHHRIVFMTNEHYKHYDIKSMYFVLESYGFKEMLE